LQSLQIGFIALGPSCLWGKLFPNSTILP
jgi:hypothetical protein